MIVLDASVAAKLVLIDEARADQAAALARRCIQQGEPIVAPQLLPSEMANILRQRRRRTALPLVAARQLLADFFALAIMLAAPAELMIAHFSWLMRMAWRRRTTHSISRWHSFSGATCGPTTKR